MPGTLFVVATPIGNLEDITYRAVRILAEVDAIAAEDTRQTRKLLDHYNIRTPMVSCHEHNEQSRSAELAARLEAGAAIALVSDAGTPLVSDPGHRLVERAIAAGAAVVPIPGPCAAIAAASASGLPVDRFLFAGFPPPKSGQRLRAFERLRSSEETLVLYEAPHRIVETLAAIRDTFGPERPVVVAREITKIHEEFVRGTAAEVHRELAARPVVKGECCLLVGPAAGDPEPVGDGAVVDAVRASIAAGNARMDAIKQVARVHGIPKRDVYRLAEEHGL